jgi:hypothetical protein
MSRSRFLFATFLALIVTFTVGALAGPMVTTGSAVRTKSIGPITAKVYSITHQMAEKPGQKSKQAVIEADVDKQFVWYMQRDVDAAKIKNAMRDAFKMNGYGDSGKIEQFVGAFGKGDVVEYDRKKDPKPSVVIFYSAANKAVTINVTGHGSATIAGQDFMKAVWSIWFGKIDQPAMGDQLISAL